LQRGLSRHGLDRNEFLHLRGYFQAYGKIVVNYVSDFSSMTLTSHLEGEEVFGSANHNIDCSPRAYDELHRLGCVNFSWLCVAIPTCQPNIVDDLHIHGSQYVPQSMYPIVSQGGIKVNKIMCGDGHWHIEWCPPSYVM